MPSFFKDPARNIIVEVRVDQKLPVFLIFIPRPPEHTFPCDDKLRAASRHQILGPRATKPRIPIIGVCILRLRLHAFPKRFSVM